MAGESKAALADVTDGAQLDQAFRKYPENRILKLVARASEKSAEIDWSATPVRIAPPTATMQLGAMAATTKKRDAHSAARNWTGSRNSSEAGCRFSRLSASARTRVRTSFEPSSRRNPGGPTSYELRHRRRCKRNCRSACSAALPWSPCNSSRNWGR